MAGAAGTTPITIIAGSFAAGKTALCNHWLAALSREGRRVAVIAHRFAEEYACQANPLDRARCALLEEVYDYGSGCLCCTPGGELGLRLESMRLWGEAYDRVLLRLGPAADPLLFAAAAGRAGGYSVEGIVTVVDAQALLREDLLAGDAARHQVEVADVVLLRSSSASAGLESAAEQQIRAAPCAADVVWWTDADLRWALSCRPGHRQYPAVQPPLPALVVSGALWKHATPFRALQINERELVCPSEARDWVCRWLQRGCCIRVKAVLAFTSGGKPAVLLADAVRGRSPIFQELPEGPEQCRMGDLEVLVSSTTVEAAMGCFTQRPVVSRVFVLLGPPRMEGLGDLAELAEYLPTADELADDFRDRVVLKGCVKSVHAGV